MVLREAHGALDQGVEELGDEGHLANFERAGGAAAAAADCC